MFNSINWQQALPDVLLHVAKHHYGLIQVLSLALACGASVAVPQSDTLCLNFFPFVVIHYLKNQVVAICPLHPRFVPPCLHRSKRMSCFLQDGLYKSVFDQTFREIFYSGRYMIWLSNSPFLQDSAIKRMSSIATPNGTLRLTSITPGIYFPDRIRSYAYFVMVAAS